LLDACPDLLYIRDCRGSTPLQYVPAAVQADWCRFLSRQPLERLRPRELKVIVTVVSDGDTTVPSNDK